MGRIEEGAQTKLAALPWVLGWKETNPLGSFAWQPGEADFSAPAVVLFERQAQGDGEMDAWNPNSHPLQGRPMSS